MIAVSFRGRRCARRSWGCSKATRIAANTKNKLKIHQKVLIRTAWVSSGESHNQNGTAKSDAAAIAPTITRYRTESKSKLRLVTLKPLSVTLNEPSLGLTKANSVTIPAWNDMANSKISFQKEKRTCL